jgi:transposase
VVLVTEGRDSITLEEFSQFLSGHKGNPEQITSVSMDMSPAFIKGVAAREVYNALIAPHVHHRW